MLLKKTRVWLPGICVGTGDPSGMNPVLVERFDPKMVTSSPRATAGGVAPTKDAALTKPAAVNDGWALSAVLPALNSAMPNTMAHTDSRAASFITTTLLANQLNRMGLTGWGSVVRRSHSACRSITGAE